MSITEEYGAFKVEESIRHKWVNTVYWGNECKFWCKCCFRASFKSLTCEPIRKKKCFLLSSLFIQDVNMHSGNGWETVITFRYGLWYITNMFCKFSVVIMSIFQNSLILNYCKPQGHKNSDVLIPYANSESLDQPVHRRNLLLCSDIHTDLGPVVQN